jgi:hypothetical protein
MHALYQVSLPAGAKMRIRKHPHSTCLQLLHYLQTTQNRQFKSHHNHGSLIKHLSHSSHEALFLLPLPTQISLDPSHHGHHHLRTEVR